MPESDTHHLYYDKIRGWQLRFTIVLPKSSKRMKRTLKTHDKAYAIAIRDLIVAEYNHLGLKLARFEFEPITEEDE